MAISSPNDGLLQRHQSSQAVRAPPSTNGYPQEVQAMNTTEYGTDNARGMARVLRERGIYAVPLIPGTKETHRTGWQHSRIEAESIDTEFSASSNLGVLLGEPSGWLVDVDLDCPEALVLARHFLPETGLIHGRKGAPGSHHYYISPGVGTEKFRDPAVNDGKGMLVEIRSTGCQTMAPPSTHPDGDVLVWEEFGDPAHIAVEALRQQVAHLAGTALLARHWPAEGNRNDCAMAVAGFLLRGGLSVDLVEKVVELASRAAGDNESRARKRVVLPTSNKLAAGDEVTGGPTLGELLRGGQSVVSKLAVWFDLDDDSSEPRVRFTDLGNARRFATQHATDAIYVPQWGAWGLWDGTRFVRDELGQIEVLAHETVEAMHAEARSCPHEELGAKLAEHAWRTEAGARLREMEKLARTFCAVSASALDADSLLLNCANGTLDLRDGVLRPHDRADRLTMNCGTVFDETASAGRWMQFLDEITCGDVELAQYLQRLAGYCLSGSTKEQEFYLLYGVGANGKSTFLEVLRALLGDYALQADFTTFLASAGDKVRNDIARLRGARLVVATEMPAGRAFDEVLMKQLTGGDSVPARFLYQETFEYVPAFKIVLAANHEPVIRGEDEGIWRRAIKIPFSAKIPPQERDKGLLPTLKGELPGILNWALAGYRDWLERGGLAPPAAVLQATTRYRQRMAPVTRFLDEMCLEMPAETVGATELYEAYAAWALRNQEVPMSQTNFGKVIQEKGFRRTKSGTVFYEGLRLMSIQ